MRESDCEELVRVVDVFFIAMNNHLEDDPEIIEELSVKKCNFLEKR